MYAHPSSTVWIDDSHEIVRRGMAACLDQAGFIIRGESALLSPLPTTVDLDILMFEYAELRLPLVMSVVADAPTRLVATVRHAADGNVLDVVEPGTYAILSYESLTPTTLVSNLRGVAAGTALPSAGVLVQRLATVTPRCQRCPPGLNSRERSILRSVADGHDTRRIAADLHLSERTIKNVIHDVLSKLHSRTRAQAVALATREGLI